MTAKLLPLTRRNTWEIEIYNSSGGSPVNVASYCNQVQIQVDPANETGLYRQFVDLELQQPVMLTGQTPVTLRRNVGNLQAGNRVRIRYRKTDNSLVTVFEGTIFRFIDQGFRKITLRAACYLSALDTTKPAGNFANNADPFGATVTAQSCINNIFTRAGYGAIDHANGTVSGNPAFPLNKPDGEGLATQAGKLISQFSRNFLWHNPRTNTIQAWPMSLTGSVARTFSDNAAAFALLEYDSDLDTATTKTAVTSVVPAEELQGSAEYSVTTTFDGVSVTVAQSWTDEDTRVNTRTVVTPLAQLQEEDTRDRWGNPSGSDTLTTTTTTTYVGGWIATQVTTEVGGVFYADANWIKDRDELYSVTTSVTSSQTLRQTTVTYTSTTGNLDSVVTLEESHDWVRAPLLPASSSPTISASLRDDQETTQTVQPVAGGYQVDTITKRWEYDDLGTHDRIVGGVQDPQFSEDPSQVETQPTVKEEPPASGDWFYYKVGTQEYRGVYTGTNTDVNPFLDEIREISAEYCDSDAKCLDFAELQHKLAVGKEEALTFEVDATDTLLDNWRPWEIWQLTKFGVTNNYVITEIAFFLNENTASFRGRGLKL